MTTLVREDLERFETILENCAVVAAALLMIAFEVEDYEFVKQLDGLGRAVSVTRKLVRERMLP